MFALIAISELHHRGRVVQRALRMPGSWGQLWVLIAVREFRNTEGHKSGFTRSELNSISVEYAYKFVDFRKVLSLVTRGMKDFSYLIGANFSDLKTGR